MARRFDVPGLKALGLSPSDFGQQSSSSFLSHGVARVDPSGNDSTGVVGDLSNPFVTSQAAVDALATSGVPIPILHIGSNTVDGFVTQLPLLVVVGDFATDGSKGGTINGFIDSDYSESAQQLFLQNVLVHDIAFSNPNGLQVNLAGSRVTTRVFNDGDLVINGDGLGSCSVGKATSANAHAISLGDVSVIIYIGNDDLVTKDCTVFLTRIPFTCNITADTLVLGDSRNAGGVVSANEVVYSDQWLKNIIFPDSDPHVPGAGYWVAGVLTKSAG